MVRDEALILLLYLLLRVALPGACVTHDVSQLELHVAFAQGLLDEAAFFEHHFCRFKLSDLLLTILDLVDDCHDLIRDFRLVLVFTRAVGLVLEVELSVAVDWPLAESTIPHLQNL